jgi:6-phospho-3-hexuloisomerase|uniref:SIS domain-containing protein n=1 Tax=Desulfobacca acetoxidans TaxID=60893 RepID=A0A7C3WIX2_9BACT
MCLPNASREAFFSEAPAGGNLSEALDQMLQELSGVFARLAPGLAESLIKEIEAAPRIFGCAVGRSGFILRGFLMRLMHLGLTVYVVGETVTPRLKPNDLLLVISGSGETAQPREVLRRANIVGARTLAITANPDSTIGREAQMTLHIPGTTKLTMAQEPASAQCPGSLFEQAVFLFLEGVVLILYKHRLRLSHEEMLSRHADVE